MTAMLSLPECVAVFLLGTLFFILGREILSRYWSPFVHLQGPPNSSWLYGNRDDTIVECLPLNQQWSERYGSNFRIRGLFSIPQLYTTDTRLINHVLTHSMEYYKPEESRRGLARILGRGVVVMEGERHRHQRRVMNPAFGPAQIRELTEVFLEKADHLCEYWSAQIDARDGCLRTNVMDGMSKTTLDVIGLAGFNYQFDALSVDKPPNELSQAFKQIFKKPPKVSLISLVRALVPALDFFRDARRKKVDEAQASMQRIARQLLEERKAEIMRESDEKYGVVAKRDLQGRDLLTLLLKANMATDIPENQRLTDEEVLAQVPTFLVAGHETTSNATTWCLAALCQYPHIQHKLREEILSVPTDTPTMDDLVALPYLDQVVRETLRLHAPVTLTSRVAQCDDVLPISEAFKDRHGNVLREIRITKGSRVVIPIAALNTSETLWGQDANEFRPERWDAPPEAASSIPGVWGHLLTFLGGPHACIGYRFSLVEMKALVFTLIRTFEFELDCTPEDIIPLGNFIKRPSLRSEKEKGAQLPLLIRPYKR